MYPCVPAVISFVPAVAAEMDSPGIKSNNAISRQPLVITQPNTSFNTQQGSELLWKLL